jgi:HEAT repeat protein
MEVAQNEKDLKVRRAAVSALGEIKTPKARDALMKIIEKK